MDLLLPNFASMSSRHDQESELSYSPPVLKVRKPPIIIKMPTCDFWIEGMWNHILKKTYHLTFSYEEDDYLDCLVDLFREEPTNFIYISEKEPSNSQHFIENFQSYSCSEPRSDSVDPDLCAFTDIKQDIIPDAVVCDPPSSDPLRVCGGGENVLLTYSGRSQIVECSASCIDTVNKIVKCPVRNRKKKKYMFQDRGGYEIRVKRPDKIALAPFICDDDAIERDKDIFQTSGNTRSICVIVDSNCIIRDIVFDRACIYRGLRRSVDRLYHDLIGSDFREKNSVLSGFVWLVGLRPYRVPTLMEFASRAIELCDQQVEPPG